MSGEKRPAANSFGSAQLVKRAKSEVNDGTVAVVGNQNGALIQAVRGLDDCRGYGAD